MSTRAREHLDLFVTASVHEDGPYQIAQGRAAVEELVRRCVEMGAEDGITREEMEAEVGDLAAYFRATIARKNTSEAKRLADDAIADRKERDE